MSARQAIRAGRGAIVALPYERVEQGAQIDAKGDGVVLVAPALPADQQAEWLDDQIRQITEARKEA